MTFDALLNLSVPLSPQSGSKDNDSICLLGLLWACSEQTSINQLSPGSEGSQHSVNAVFIMDTDPVNYVTQVHWPHPNTSAFQPLLKAASPLLIPTITTKGPPRNDSNRRIMWICRSPRKALAQGCYYRCVTGKAPGGAWKKRGPNRENGKYERWTVISLELIPGAGLPGALKEIQRQTLRPSQQVDPTRRKTGNI